MVEGGKTRIREKNKKENLERNKYLSAFNFNIDVWTNFLQFRKFEMQQISYDRR